MLYIQHNDLTRFVASIFSQIACSTEESQRIAHYRFQPIFPATTATAWFVYRAMCK